MEWEYKTITLRTEGFFGGKFDPAQLDAMLNGFGRDRWEVISAFGTAESYGRTRDVVVILKRPREA